MLLADKETDQQQRITKTMFRIKTKNHKALAANGFTLLELLIVVAIIVIVSAIALPQLIASRRLLRLSTLPRQVTSQLRLARQMSMSNRVAVTFQYNDSTKQMKLISYQTSGASIVADPTYPNNAGSTVISTVPLAVGGIVASDISYGIPVGLPTGALSDGTTKTALNGSSQINITFQPDGSVRDANNQPLSFALFFYNSQKPADTATAVSVLGSAGRVKIWRYNSSATKYLE